MLNLHIYEPRELSSIDRRALASLELSLEDAECVVYVTRLSDVHDGWTGWPINPDWRISHRGHWFVFYHA